MTLKIVFFPSQDEILVQEVYANSILYNVSDVNYKNGISLETGKSGNKKIRRVKQFSIFTMIITIAGKSILT